MIKMIISLQKTLFLLLSSSKELSSKINGVYNHVPQETKFPYIYLGEFYAKDWSTKTNEALNVTFKLEIFSRLAGNKELLEIMQIIEILFKNAKQHNIKISSIEHMQLKDGITHVLNVLINIKMMENI